MLNGQETHCAYLTAPGICMGNATDNTNICAKVQQRLNNFK